jgi:hypothetical protein
VRRDGKPKYVTRRADEGDGDPNVISIDAIRNSRHTPGLPNTVREQPLPADLPSCRAEEEERIEQLTEEQQMRRELAQKANVEKVQQELEALKEVKRLELEQLQQQERRQEEERQAEKLRQKEEKARRREQFSTYVHQGVVSPDDDLSSVSSIGDANSFPQLMPTPGHTMEASAPLWPAQRSVWCMIPESRPATQPSLSVTSRYRPLSPADSEQSAAETLTAVVATSTVCEIVSRLQSLAPLLEESKQRAADEERYQDADLLKRVLTDVAALVYTTQDAPAVQAKKADQWSKRISALEAEMSRLEAEKMAAVEAEDFEQAQQLKQHISECKQDLDALMRECPGKASAESAHHKADNSLSAYSEIALADEMQAWELGLVRLLRAAGRELNCGTPVGRDCPLPKAYPGKLKQAILERPHLFSLSEDGLFVRLAGTAANADKELQCCGCMKMFTWTGGEQSYFEAKGLLPPRRCAPCRKLMKNTAAQQCL